MPTVPGYCSHCDLVFEGVGGIQIENSTNVRITNCRMSCPQCGRPAKLAEGTFNVRGDKFELLSGPPLTADILARLYDIAKRAQSSKITEKEAIREAKELNPVLGTLLERFLTLGLSALGTLLALIAVYMQHQSIELQNESLALQKESLEIQKLDSNASGDFYRDALDLLEKQTRNLNLPSGPQRTQKRIDGKGDRLTKAETGKKPMVVKPKSKRRNDVNAQRRKELLERRKAFPRQHRKPS